MKKELIEIGWLVLGATALGIARTFDKLPADPDFWRNSAQIGIGALCWMLFVVSMIKWLR